jgi:VIT1/CCC1 family predicted Fe2+/Mn2+ transporter
MDAELGIDPNNLTNPMHAAIASGAAFTFGAIIPIIAIVLPPLAIRIPVTFAAVLTALVLTGILSAKISGARMLPVTMRVVIGGILAMAITFAIGHLFNAIV